MKKTLNVIGTIALAALAALVISLVLYIQFVGKINKFNKKCTGFRDNAFMFHSAIDNKTITDCIPGTHDYYIKDIDSTCKLYARVSMDSCGDETNTAIYIFKKNETGEIVGGEIINQHQLNHSMLITNTYPIIVESKTAQAQ